MQYIFVKCSILVGISIIYYTINLPKMEKEKIYLLNVHKRRGKLNITYSIRIRIHFNSTSGHKVVRIV